MTNLHPKSLKWPSQEHVSSFNSTVIFSRGEKCKSWNAARLNVLCIPSENKYGCLGYYMSFFCYNWKAIPNYIWTYLEAYFHKIDKPLKKNTFCQFSLILT